MEVKCVQQLLIVRILDKIFDDYFITPFRVGSGRENEKCIVITYLHGARTMVIDVYDDCTMNVCVIENTEVVYEQYIGKNLRFKKAATLFMRNEEN